MYGTSQKLIAEFLGTFALIFFGAGSICTDQYLHGTGGLGLLGIALAFFCAPVVAQTISVSPSDVNAYSQGATSVLLTFGGPGTSTQTVAYFLWEQVWVFNKFSFGAAASILLLFIFSILIFFGVYMLISQRRAVEGSAP